MELVDTGEEAVVALAGRGGSFEGLSGGFAGCAPLHASI